MSYDNYINYIKEIGELENSDFKRNSFYTEILEHVSYELGSKYLTFIESDFNIDYNNIIQFVNINDKYGNTYKYNYRYKENEILCSPTSLRYIYHALLILEHYKKTNCINIVEVGCGYGGLCLAINYFSKLSNIYINNYNIIDIPEVLNLIKKYLDVNKEYIQTNIIYHSSQTYGSDIIDQQLFFISNYCYTEIPEIHNTNYSKILLPKTNNGFIAWQHGGGSGYSIDKSSEITGKNISNIIEEKPQTTYAYGCINYFVYF